MNRDFKGIWIPKEVWLNKELSVMEKLFLVEIDSLDGTKGCFASNAHFSEFFGVSKGRCTQIIKSLEAKKLIKITLNRKEKIIQSRVVRVVNKLNRVVNKLNTPSEYIKQGYLENDEGSNTKDSNTKDSNAFEKFWDLYNKKKDTKKCKAKFSRLTDEQVEKIFKTLPNYISSTPDLTYRKLPLTYLNGECWDDEVVTSIFTNNQMQQGRTFREFGT